MERGDSQLFLPDVAIVQTVDYDIRFDYDYDCEGGGGGTGTERVSSSSAVESFLFDADFGEDEGESVSVHHIVGGDRDYT